MATRTMATAAVISVPYQVLIEDTPADGPTVRYLVSWDDAFTFFDEILGRTPPPGVTVPRCMTTEPTDQVVATHVEVAPRGMRKTPGTPGGVSFVDAIVTVAHDVFPGPPRAAHASGA